MQQQHSPARPREPPPPSPWVPGGSRLDWMVIRERISGANLIGLASMPIAAAPDAVRRTPELERSRAHAGAEHRTSVQWSRTPDTGSLRVDWPSCWRRAAAWGRGRCSCRRGERGRRVAALASSSRIGKWLPRHFARYTETWRNRQTLGCWAVARYRLTACAASRDVGNFGRLG